MIELELLGTSADGESLVLTDAQGERYSVLISDELRGAARRDRPRIEVAPTRPTLAPRDIQALLRAGATPEEIAAQHGMDAGAVERFEAPVQAEKDYALTRARAVRIGEGGPTMGDLVLDRLAARGVDPSSLEWSATREVSEPWQIAVTFVQGAAEHAAHWSLSASGTLEAIDQEAQWLTEQVSSSPTASIFTPLPRAAAPDPGGEDLRAREALVDQLNAARGKRQRVEVDLGEEDEEAEYLAAISAPEPEEREPEASTGPISARIYSLASARTKGEPSDQAEAPSYPAPPEPPAARPARRFEPLRTVTVTHDPTGERAASLAEELAGIVGNGATGAGAATITGPPTLTPGAGIPATGAGTPANHCPTDGAPAMSAKTRTMTATMMPGTMTAG